MDEFIWQLDGRFIRVQNGEISVAGPALNVHPDYYHNLSTNKPRWTLVEDIIEAMFIMDRNKFEKMYLLLSKESEGYKFSTKLLKAELKTLRKKQERIESLLAG